MLKTYNYKTSKYNIEYKVSEENELIEKKCITCSAWKSINEFGFHIGNFMKKRYDCNACVAEAAKKLRYSKGAKPKKPFIEEINGEIYRLCSKCNEKKSLNNDFDKSKSGYLGHDSLCKLCKRKNGELLRRNAGMRKKEIPTLKDESGVTTHRKCSKCFEFKPLVMFHKHKSAPLGVHPYCRDCAKERHMIQKYGITKEEKSKLYEQQGNICACCHQSYDLDNMCIDHCHETQQVRGILCDKCNISLGLIGESYETAINLANYIKEKC